MLGYGEDLDAEVVGGWTGRSGRVRSEGRAKVPVEGQETAGRGGVNNHGENRRLLERAGEQLFNKGWLHLRHHLWQAVITTPRNQRVREHLKSVACSGTDGTNNQTKRRAFKSG